MFLLFVGPIIGVAVAIIAAVSQKDINDED